MYLEHYGLAEPPFRITPHTEFFYQGANRGATLEALLYAIQHGEGLVKVTGEVGSGKTMLGRVLMERLPQHVDTVYLANPSLSRDDILHAIAEDLKIPVDGRPSTIIRVLQNALVERFAAGRQVVVLIDEAHAMPEESLEEIRLLSNLDHGHSKLMQIVLFGQPELDDVLARQHMRQLKERITHSFQLAPLRQGDVGEYIMFRLRTAGYKGPDVFSAPALQKIASESEGLTRRINILADKALISAFSDNRHMVEGKDADAAIRDSGFRSRKARGGKRWWLAAAAMGFTALGLLAGFFANNLLTHNAPAASAVPVRGEIRAAPAAIAPKAPPPAQPEVSASPAVTAPSTSNMPPAAKQPAAPDKPATSVAPTVANTPSAAPVASTAPVKDVAPAHEAPPSNEAAKQLPTPLPETLASRIKTTLAMVHKESPQSVTIQLSSIPSDAIQNVSTFLSRAARLVPDESLYLYAYKNRADAPAFFGVLYGLYPDRSSAARALHALPMELQRDKPVLRTLGGIREESDTTQPTTGK